VNAIQRKRVRTVVTFAVVGALGGSVLGLIIGQIDQRILLWSGVRGLSVGVLIGVAVGVGEEFLLPRWSRRFRFFTLNTLRVLMYSAVMLLALVLVNGIAIAIGSRVGFIEGARRYLFDDPLTRDFLTSLVTVVVLTSVLEIRTFHSRGEMWRFHGRRSDRDLAPGSRLEGCCLHTVFFRDGGDARGAGGQVHGVVRSSAAIAAGESTVVT
jgi:hypothetical protein